MIQRALEIRFEVEVVAWIRRRAQMLGRLEALQPQVVAIGLQRNEDDSVTQAILEAIPESIVIAVSSDLRFAFLQSQRHPRRLLEQFSPRELADELASMIEQR